MIEEWVFKMLAQLVIISTEINNAIILLIINWVLVFSVIFNIINTCVFTETTYVAVISLIYIIRFLKV